MSLPIKFVISLTVLCLAAAAIFFAWAPLLVTYVPIAQVYHLKPEQAEIIENILASRSQNYEKSIKICSALILVNLLIGLVLVWVPQGKKSANT